MQTQTKETKTVTSDENNKEFYPSHDFFFNLGSGAKLSKEKIEEFEKNYYDLLGELSLLQIQNDELKEQLEKHQWKDIKDAPHDCYLAVGWFESNEKHPMEFKWVKGFFIKEFSLEADYEEYDANCPFLEENEESAYFKEGWYTFADPYGETLRPISPTHYKFIESTTKSEVVEA